MRLCENRPGRAASLGLSLPRLDGRHSAEPSPEQCQAQTSTRRRLCTDAAPMLSSAISTSDRACRRPATSTSATWRLALRVNYRIDVLVGDVLAIAELPRCRPSSNWCVDLGEDRFEDGEVDRFNEVMVETRLS